MKLIPFLVRPRPSSRQDGSPQLALSIRAAHGMALLTSRRQFLRRTLEGAFVLGASSASVGTLFEEQAWANHSAPCGPAPLCTASGCDTALQKCKSPCKNQHYNGGHCDSHYNCWAATNPPTLCCDCCCPSTSYLQCPAPGHNCNPPGQCSNCGGTYYKCICNFACC